jgi:uncharacterized membrane protein
MNLSHLHLLSNHLPIIGSILGGIVLGYGLWTKSNHTIIAAYLLLIISSAGAVVAYLTGEAAEHAVKNIQGVSKNLIEEHSDAAVYALVALIFLGVVAIIGLYLTWKASALSRKIAWIALFISLLSFIIVARTGYIGGQIRHTEIYSPVANPANDGEHDDKD